MTKNFFYTILLSISNILFPIISFPYVSRILKPEGIGKVQFIVSLSQYFALFAALGIPIYGITQAAKYKDNHARLATVFWELTGIYTITSIIFFTLYCIMLFAFPFFSANHSLYLYAGALVLLSFLYTDWFYAGIEDFRIITLRSVIVKLIALLMLFIFVKTEADFGKYLFIIIFSILGNQLYSFSSISAKMPFRFADLHFKQHIKPLLYIFSAGIAASIYTVLDIVLLGFLSDGVSVGLYTASVKLIKLTIPFVTAMGVVLIPSISKHFSENRVKEVNRLLNNSFNFLVFIAIPGCVGMALLAPELIDVFSGSAFSPATTSMQILAILPLLIGFGHLFSFQVLIPAGKNREVFLSMLAGAVVFLLLNFLLVPAYREKGASVANISAELIVTLSYLYFVRKNYSFTYNWRFFWQVLFAVLSFIPLVWLTRSFGLNAIPTLCIAVVTCAAVYLFVQVVVFKNRFLFTFIDPLKKKLGLGDFTKMPGNE